MLALDVKFTLADNDLPKVTRSCDIAGIDVAFPLLHEAVVDFSTTLPPDFKLRGARLRYFFKEALRDFLPEAIIAKHKHGFGLPTGIWLRDNTQLRQMAGDAARQSTSAPYIQRHDAGRVDEPPSARARGLLRDPRLGLMMLEMWFQNHAAKGSKRRHPRNRSPYASPGGSFRGESGRPQSTCPYRICTGTSIPGSWGEHRVTFSCAAISKVAGHASLQLNMAAQAEK